MLGKATEFCSNPNLTLGPPPCFLWGGTTPGCPGLADTLYIAEPCLAPTGSTAIPFYPSLPAPEFLSRLSKDVRNHILQLNMVAHGNTGWGIPDSCVKTEGSGVLGYRRPGLNKQKQR